MMAPVTALAYPVTGKPSALIDSNIIPSSGLEPIPGLFLHCAANESVSRIPYAVFLECSIREREVEFLSRAFRQLKNSLDLLLQISVGDSQPHIERLDLRHVAVDGVFRFMKFNFPVHKFILEQPEDCDHG